MDEEYLALLERAYKLVAPKPRGGRRYQR
jgi:hypothetical protein